MVKATLTSMQFAAKTQELKANGLTLNGAAGVAVKDGIQVAYSYEQNELYCAVVKHPMLEPTSMIEKKIAEWIGGEVVTEPTAAETVEAKTLQDDAKLDAAAQRG